jgi:cyclic 2,3-diphosphoglycerate synthetase
MDDAQEFEVLLTELKAAAVDVACQRALQRGADVVFVDNRAVVVGGDADLPTLLGETIDLAAQRGRRRNKSA